MDTFLKLIDRIISLVKTREENKAKLFKEIVQPLYEEFEKLVIQYFSFFRSTLHTIDDTELEIVVKDLKKQRGQYIQARIKIVSMLETIKENLGNTDILEFCNALKEFFFVNKENQLQQLCRGSLYNDTTMQQLLMYAHNQAEETSRGSILLRMLEEYIQEKQSDKENEVPLEDIMYYIEETLAKMEESWSSASSIYAKLRLNYLLSIHI